MNKLYGYSIILFSGMLILLFGSMWLYGVYKVISNASFHNGGVGALVQPLIFLLPSVLFLKRGLAILKEQVLISVPENGFSSAFFYLGGLLIMVSIAGILISIFLVVYLVIAKSTGVPVGIGVGLSIIPFIIGASLIELLKGKAS